MMGRLKRDQGQLFYEFHHLRAGASPTAPRPRQRDGPYTDVDVVEVRGGDEGFDGRRIHVPLFAEARSIASNSVSLKRQPSASRLALA